MSTHNSLNDNPAEPKAIVVTVAEAGLPENPEIVNDSALELSQEDKSSPEETQDSNHLMKVEENKHEVTFASRDMTISYESEEDTQSVISILLEEYLTSSFFNRLPLILSTEEITSIELQDKFTQTFFKAMTKLSNRRFVEIINMQVDHEDPTLVFFCPSYELLTSFHENEENIIN